MDEVFLRLAERFSNFRREMGRDAYLEAVRRTELGLARLALELAQGAAPTSRKKNAVILQFPLAESEGNPGAG